MRALTISQPWASLIALGHKTLETRGWATKYRGPVAIHAGKGLPYSFATGQPLRIGQRFTLGPFEVERDKAGLLLRGESLSWPYRLPQGAVVATAYLAAVEPTKSDWPLSPERDYGDHSEGRYAWLLTDVEPIRQPALGVRGALGLWTWRPTS